MYVWSCCQAFQTSAFSSAGFLSSAERQAVELGGPEGLFDGGLDGVELVIPGHLLNELPAPVVIEHDEVSQEGKEVALVADAFQHYLEFREVGGAGFLILHGFPGLEPLFPRGQGADPGVESVGGYKELVHREQGWEFGLVCLELLPGVPDVGVLVGGVLEFDDAERQAVQEEDYVRAAGGLILLDRELVDGQPVVGPLTSDSELGWVFEVDDGRGFSARRTIGPSDGDGHSAGDGMVKGPVPCLQGRSIWVNEAPETGFQC